MSQKPILLYTAPTPNPFCVSILLEELKAVYGNVVDYDIEKIEFSKRTQKEPWFLAMNPNGRVPVIKDRSRGDYHVFETSAILLYLEQHYDPEFRFSFDPAKQPDDYSDMLQWLFFVHGGLGPIAGQAYYFLKIAPEQVPFAQNRFVEETKRLYGVLETRLAGREYLAGPGEGSFSIADIKSQPWARAHSFTGIESLNDFPNVKAWVERIDARPGVKAGLEAK